MKLLFTTKWIVNEPMKNDNPMNGLFDFLNSFLAISLFLLALIVAIIGISIFA